MKELWKANCVQLSEFDETISSKEEEINHLKGQLLSCTCRFTENEFGMPVASTSPRGTVHGRESSQAPKRGKAPPVDSFNASVKTSVLMIGYSTLVQLE